VILYIYIYIKSRKKIWPSDLSLYGELDVVMHAVKVVQKVIHFFWSMGSGYERVINVMEPADRLVGRPAERQFFEVLLEEVGNSAGGST
jgi:hypothetical protein